MSRPAALSCPSKVCARRDVYCQSWLKFANLRGACQPCPSWLPTFGSTGQLHAPPIFSSRSRPIHFGAYPLHRLARLDGPASLEGVETPVLSFARPEDPESIVNAMAEHQAMLDTIRDGLVNGARSDIPYDPKERTNHLKSFGNFNDASSVGIGALSPDHGLRRRAAILRSMTLRNDQQQQTKTLAAGIDRCG